MKEKKRKEREKDTKRSEKRAMRVLYVKLDVEVQVYIHSFDFCFSLIIRQLNGLVVVVYFFFFRFLVCYTLSALFQDRKYCKLCMYYVCVHCSLTQILRKCYSMQPTWKQQHTISTHHFVNE